MEKRFYSSLHAGRYKPLQAREVSREPYSPRLGALVESVVGSTAQTKREAFRNRSNSCTPAVFFSSQQSVPAPSESRPSSRLASEFALSVAEILDQLIWGLWEDDDAHGQPGHSLLTVIPSAFDYVIPYRKQNHDSGSCTLLDLAIRVQLFALSLNQSSAGHSRFLRSLRHVITKFPSYLFEESPELFAAATFHLLSLCSSSRGHVRTEAVTTLYLLMRNHFVLTKNLVCVKTHLHTAFATLFATNELRENPTVFRPNRLTTNCPGGYIAKLRKQPLFRIEQNLNMSLSMLRMYAKRDRDFADSSSDLKLTSIASWSNRLPPPETNQALHAVFQAIEDDQMYNFPIQVIQIADNLQRLFADVVHLQNKLSGQDKQNRVSRISLEDSFSVIDLLHSIANRHRSCPELRLFWLMQITEKHYELSQFAEAAQCLCHCAAIVAEHLVNRGLVPTGVAAIGCADIAEAVGNMNLLEDSCICGPNGPGANGICCPSPLLLSDLYPSVSGLDTAWYFSPPGWAALIAWTAGAFAKAGSYELVPRIYSRLIPALEAANEYGRLAEVHGRIKEAYTALEKMQRGKRLFSTFFRVGFYGSLFNELDGLEFIYKEPPLTKLAEITHRLSSFYAKQFGDDRVVVVKDSKLIEKRSLDPSKVLCSLQRFVYSIPFTTSGAAHGTLSEQFQQRHILTAARYFPYVKSRLVVVSTRQEIICPIEVALEDVLGRVKQLDQALSKDPVDVKFLQMVLQGGIGTTVNQGPLEVATTFLRPAAGTEFESHRSTVVTDQAAYVDCQNRLRVCFRQLLDKSYKALCVNRELIGPDQVEYHRELERNYTNVHSLIAPLLNVDPNSGDEC
ncbi:Dedicator of cytokinesis protein 8 [Fasciolopsis buskii]|uniref:Dedicator of cytokinesis protein 8 n=1 Tax=Fasciolopsis buskii TaxID=27845 RepID=A0A8E0RLH9_9TREM|nr:Dedicator of cytokinesis protein 8 [Fasciolopsis buski]